jgi:ribosomal protein L11 methyltransferase
VNAFLELSFDLGGLDADSAESAAFACGAFAVTFVDARDDPVYHPAKSGPTHQATLSPLDKTPDFAGAPVLEPAPGEMPLWAATRVKCLFPSAAAHEPGLRTTVATALAATLGIDVSRIETRLVADRPWEREWLKDFHAMCFGRRLWVSPHHEHVSAPDAVVVALDPGLAFGTGTHASTALCLTWLDAHFPDSPAPAKHFAETQVQGLDAHFPDSPAPARHFAETQGQGLDAHLPQGAQVIDYGCGSGVLAIAAARLGAAEVHAYDIDPQALIATADNARANDVLTRLQLHASAATLPGGTDVLLANILAAPLCALAPRFAALLRPGGQVVLAGLMEHEAAEVTAAYRACFDVVRFGERDGWACLTGRRR